MVDLGLRIFLADTHTHTDTHAAFLALQGPLMRVRMFLADRHIAFLGVPLQGLLPLDLLQVQAHFLLSIVEVD